MGLAEILFAAALLALAFACFCAGVICGENNKPNPESEVE